MNKKFTVLLAIVLSFSSYALAQWEWVNPKPSGYTGSKVFFTDSLNGLIFYSNGDLVTTNDQGITWNFKQNFSGTLTMDIKDSTGVICGYNGLVYLSTDNGNSWQWKNAGIADNLFYLDIVSRDTIFMASSTGRIYRSDDRGNCWKTFYVGAQISSIEFINSKVGYAGGKEYHIYKTEDGGLTWQKNVTVNH